MENNFLNFLKETIKLFVLALIIVLPIRYFLFRPFVVTGQSMEPNFEQGNYLIVDEISYRFQEPQRGEVVVFKPPFQPNTRYIKRIFQPNTRYIKRIVGLPGETIEIKEGKVFINGEVLKESYLPPYLETPGNISLVLKEDEYFVLGDNRYFSFDSRKWGPLPRKNIIGRVFLRAFPFNQFDIFTNYQY